MSGLRLRRPPPTICGPFSPGTPYESGGAIKNAQGENIGNFPGGTNMAFGGPDGKLLFVVSGGSNVRAIHMNVPGIP